PGEWKVRVDRPGFTGEELTLDVVPGETEHRADWTLTQHGEPVVEARHAGSPVAGAHVTVTQGATEVGHGVTGPDGRVDLGGLVPGTYTVETRAAGYRHLEESVVVTAGRPADPPHAANLTRLGAVSGTIRTVISADSGWVVELPGAQVTAERPVAGGTQTFGAPSGALR